MGIVFLAWDERLEREVALKILRTGTVTHENSRKRFRREALTLSKLTHPGIAHVYDFDSQNGIDFLVMEYVRGTTLAQRLTHGPVPEPETIRVGQKIAQILSAAHAAGVVHCDLKPANIMITEDGNAKVLDFGVASLLRADSTAETESLTELPGVAGTLPYMAPEQVRGRAVDARTDIYALGAILYELVTGRRAFQGSAAEVIAAILSGSVEPPRKVNPTISSALDSIIVRAMSSAPARRQNSADAFSEDLERLSPGYRYRLNRVVRQRTNWIVAAAIIFVAVAGFKIEQRATRKKYSGGTPMRSVAVLPFQDLGANRDPAWRQGLVENISSKLSQVTAGHTIEVIAPGEVQTSKVIDAETARRRLGANLVLEGIIHQEGKFTHINVDLVDSESGRLLHAKTIPEQGFDPLRVEDDIVQAAVQMLELELPDSEKNVLREHGTLNSTAFELYTRGRGYLRDRETPEDIDSAINQFLQAVQLDSTFASAQAGLGQAYWKKYLLTKEPGFVAQARSACERAVKLQPANADGNVCIATVHAGTGDYQLAASEFQLALNSAPNNDDALRGLAADYEKMGSPGQAERTYKQSIHARPRYAIGYTWLGAFYSRQARYGEAAQQFEKAIALAPDNPEYWASVGGVYLQAGRYAQARNALLRSIKLRPSFAAYSNLGQTEFSLGHFKDAADAFEEAAALGPNQAVAYGNLARAYYWYPPKRRFARPTYQRAIGLLKNDLAVNPADADANLLLANYAAMIRDGQLAVTHLRSAMRLRPNDPEVMYFAALIYSQIGTRSKTLSFLQKAVKAGYSPADIGTTPEFDTLRSDSQFQRLLHSSRSTLEASVGTK